MQMAAVDRLRAIGPFPWQLATQLCNEGVALLGLRRGKRGKEPLCFRGNPSCKLRRLQLGQLDQSPRDLLDSIAPGMGGNQQYVRDLQVALAPAPLDWRDPQIANSTSNERRMHILAHLHATQGAPPTLEEGLHRFLLYVAQTRLQEPITSGHAKPSLPADPVVIIGPINPQNNVAAQMSDADREALVATATTAWEALLTARHNSYKGETHALWREVFGSSFIVEAEEVAA